MLSTVSLTDQEPVYDALEHFERVKTERTMGYIAQSYMNSR